MANRSKWRCRYAAERRFLLAPVPNSHFLILKKKNFLTFEELGINPRLGSFNRKILKKIEKILSNVSLAAHLPQLLRDRNSFYLSFAENFSKKFLKTIKQYKKRKTVKTVSKIKP